MVIFWIATTFLGFIITKGIHTGQFLISVFFLFSWPFWSFIEHESTLTFMMLMLVQLIYVAVVIGAAACVMWILVLNRRRNNPAT